MNVLQDLAESKAVLANSHFVFTSGSHGTAYVNMRAVGHDVTWMAEVGHELASKANRYPFDLVIGPETLGRTIAQFVAVSACVDAVWCDIVGEGRDKRAEFSPKLDFGRLIEGKRLVIVDDLLTTGSSVKLVSELVERSGGNVAAALVVLRRTLDVTATDCGVPALEVLADIEGFKVFTEEECARFGPCSQRVPMMLRPGHGWSWIVRHPNYPIVRTQ